MDIELSKPNAKKLLYCSLNASQCKSLRKSPRFVTSCITSIEEVKDVSNGHGNMVKKAKISNIDASNHYQGKKILSSTPGNSEPITRRKSPRFSTGIIKTNEITNSVETNVAVVKENKKLKSSLCKPMDLAESPPSPVELIKSQEILSSNDENNNVPDLIQSHETSNSILKDNLNESNIKDSLDVMDVEDIQETSSTELIEPVNNTSIPMLTEANILKHNEAYKLIDSRKKSRSLRCVSNKFVINKTLSKSMQMKNYHLSYSTAFKNNVLERCTVLHNGQIQSPHIVEGMLKNNFFQNSEFRSFLHYKPCLPDKYICDICALTFRDTFKLQRHFLEHSNEKDFFFNANSEQQQSPQVRRKYICKLCASTFKDKFKLRDLFHKPTKSDLCCSLCNKFI